MSDIIVNANKESAFLASMEQANISDPYTYRLMANFPNGSRNILSVSPQIAPSANPVSENLTFRIPRYGKIQRMVIQSKLTTGSDESATDNTNMGLRIFSDISLRAHSKQVASTGNRYATVRAFDADKEMSETIVNLSNHVQTFNAQEGTFYTPVDMWFQEKMSNYLDVSFVEQLELECTVNSQAGMGLGNALTASDFKLFIFYRNLSGEAQRAYEAKNFSPQKNLNMVIYDHYDERATIGNGDTETTLELKVPHAVYATHFYISDSTDIGPDVNISKVTVNMTGRPIFQDLPTRVLQYDWGFYKKGAALQGAFTADGGTGPGATEMFYAADLERIHTIYWGESKDRTYNSHSVACANVNNFEIVATHDDPGDATHSLHVVHEYWKICTINSSDGRVQIGFSL